MDPASLSNIKHKKCDCNIQKLQCHSINKVLDKSRSLCAMLKDIGRAVKEWGLDLKDYGATDVEGYQK